MQVPDSYLEKSIFDSKILQAQKAAQTSFANIENIHQYFHNFFELLFHLLDSPTLTKFRNRLRKNDFRPGDFNSIYSQFCYPSVQNFYEVDAYELINSALLGNQKCTESHSGFRPKCFQITLLENILGPIDTQIFKKSFCKLTLRWHHRFEGILRDLNLRSEEMIILCQLLSYSRGVAGFIFFELSKNLREFYSLAQKGVITSPFSLNAYLTKKLSRTCTAYGTYLKINTEKQNIGMSIFGNHEAYKVFCAIFFLRNTVLRKNTSVSPFHVHQELLTLLTQENHVAASERLKYYMLKFPKLLPSWQYKEFLTDEDVQNISATLQSERAQLHRESTLSQINTLLARVNSDYCEKMAYNLSLVSRILESTPSSKDFLEIFPITLTLDNNRTLSITQTNNILLLQSDILFPKNRCLSSNRKFAATYSLRNTAKILLSGTWEPLKGRYGSFRITSAIDSKKKLAAKLYLSQYYEIQNTLVLERLSEQLPSEYRDEFVRRGQDKFLSN